MVNLLTKNELEDYIKKFKNNGKVLDIHRIKDTEDLVFFSVVCSVNGEIRVLFNVGLKMSTKVARSWVVFSPTEGQIEEFNLIKDYFYPIWNYNPENHNNLKGGKRYA